MSRDEQPYSDTARALAAQIDDEDDDTLLPIAHHPRRSSTEPLWQRRSTSLPNHHDRQRPRWLQNVETIQRRGLTIWYHFTPLQRAGIVIFSAILLTLLILAVVYNERIFASLAPAAKRWRELPNGWMILWAMTFFVSFPPLIGYSSFVTIAGFVFGMKGWFIMSTATILGSTVAFVASRSVLKGLVSRLTEKNKRFTALALVLKHDGLKLLIMIRLCPLPYSLSNGAISTIPTVTWYNFMLATAIVSPKLLLHIFIGSRLGDLAENGDKMDWRTKLISYVSIVVGVVVGVGTGALIYVRTKARAKQLEAEELAAAAAAGEGVEGVVGAEFLEDAVAQQSVRGPDDMSLHTTYEDDVERSGGQGYRDDFTDDEDAQERDVFADGDGNIEDEALEPRKK